MHNTLRHFKINKFEDTTLTIYKECILFSHFIGNRNTQKQNDPIFIKVCLRCVK